MTTEHKPQPVETGRLVEKTTAQSLPEQPGTRRPASLAARCTP